MYNRGVAMKEKINETQRVFEGVGGGRIGFIFVAWTGLGRQ